MRRWPSWARTTVKCAAGSGPNMWLCARARMRESGELAQQAASDLQASYQRKFVAGRRSWLDVLNAAREVTDAQVSASDAQVLTAASATRILALTCRWRPVGV